MTGNYHEGERAVQERAGVRASAEHVGRGIHAVFSPAAREFLRAQRLAILSSVDDRGRVWVSLLTGEPGFLQTLDERTLRIDGSSLPDDDPLHANLSVRGDVGILAIDFLGRKRMRVNGTARLLGESGIEVRAGQVYGNCPKYIQARVSDSSGGPPETAGEQKRGDRLTPAQRAMIQAADTFFVGTSHPEGGADTSHRGGNPGFVRPRDDRTLEWPDYSGNTMFQTLGNISGNPSTGLLFIDFATGDTLQLTGEAEVIWDPARAAGFPGAERMVEFRIGEIIGRQRACPLRWRLVDYSPYNPA